MISMIEAELLQFAEYNTFKNDSVIALLQKKKKCLYNIPKPILPVAAVVLLILGID